MSSGRSKEVRISGFETAGALMEFGKGNNLDVAYLLPVFLSSYMDSFLKTNKTRNKGKNKTQKTKETPIRPLMCLSNMFLKIFCDKDSGAPVLTALTGSLLSDLVQCYLSTHQWT